ncbi:MAG: MBL fold metallo-hydrolase [Acidobacteria bacterium]|nr:MBL fold metallo-hydrolase [Acidobacteriota bacterium]
MTHAPLYLRNNVQVEPLFDQWYAWSHLIPPTTAARNLTERHFKIMKSYIEEPAAHAAATHNPKMLGGPFMDYPTREVERIDALLQRTRRERSHLIDLSFAIEELDSLLESEATGFSLQRVYPKVPAILRGYVELHYDLNNNPSFRFVEPLLYRTKYYDRSAQSLMLSLISRDERAFVLSTPRLPSDEATILSIPYDHEIVDWLFRLKSEPHTWEEIATRLSAISDNPSFLPKLFSGTPPRPYCRYDGPGVRWRYFGHACILIEAGGTSILFDPVLSYTYESNVSRYTYEDLPPELDFVVITHDHQDHILFETLLQIRHKVKTVVVPRSRNGALQDPSLKLILENTGFLNVVELQEMETIKFEGGEITGLPFLGEHADLDIQSKLGYLVRVASHTLLMLADSCNVEPLLYEHLQMQLGNVDVVFLGMECDGAPLSWLYGPLLTKRLDRAMDASRRLSGSDFAQALEIVNVFSPEHVYVYAMGQEPWLNYVMSIKYTDESRPIVESNRLIEHCRTMGIVAERLFGEKDLYLRG